MESECPCFRPHTKDAHQKIPLRPGIHSAALYHDEEEEGLEGTLAEEEWVDDEGTPQNHRRLQVSPQNFSDYILSWFDQTLDT